MTLTNKELEYIIEIADPRSTQYELARAALEARKQRDEMALQLAWAQKNLPYEATVTQDNCRKLLARHAAVKEAESK